MATIKSFSDKPKRKPYFKHNVVYCKKGDVVITYPNVLAAEEATGIYSDRIYKCCNGKKISAGGFAWSYTPFEEYPDDGRIWKNIKGYENLYQVSNDGLVRTSHKGLWEILSAGRTKHGYYNVLLHKGGKRKNERVHRLVASAFIPNPNNYPYINHKDENPSNNHVNNLEWCTAEYNINYGTCKERIANSNSKPILKYDLDGNFICEYKSLAEAERVLYPKTIRAAKNYLLIEDYKKLLSIIDTLEVKEVDLEKALSDLDKDIKEFVTTEEFENESTTAGHYWVIAKHAFLLGLKAQKGE